MSLSFPQDQRIAQVSLTRFVPQPMTGMHLQDQASVWPEQVTQSFCRRKKKKKEKKRNTPQRCRGSPRPIAELLNLIRPHLIYAKKGLVLLTSRKIQFLTTQEFAVVR